MTEAQINAALAAGKKVFCCFKSQRLPFRRSWQVCGAYTTMDTLWLQIGAKPNVQTVRAAIMDVWTAEMAVREMLAA